MSRRASSFLTWVTAGMLLAAGASRAAAQPVDGFVDLHSHLAAQLAFGGSWFWGTAEGDERTAVRRCDGNLGKTHGATRYPLLSEMVGSGWGSNGDTGWHLWKRNGYDRRQCVKFLGINIPGTCPKPRNTSATTSSR